MSPARAGLVGLAALAAVTGLAGCNLGVPPDVYPLSPDDEPPGTSDLLVGDVDGDGDPDVVAILARGLATALNDGSGGFTVTSVRTGAWVGGNGALADVDGDGLLDLVRAGVGETHVEVRRGDGTGRFASTREVLDASGHALFGDVTVRDLDGDGRLDVAAGTTDGAVVWYGDGPGSFAEPRFVGVAPSASDLAVADMNGDGRADLVNVGADGRRYVWVSLATGPRSFAAPTRWDAESWGGGSAGVALVDLDADGDVDVVSYTGSSEFVTVLRNDGRGRLSLPTNTGTTRQVTDVAFADLDGDGTVDVASDYAVLFGTGDGRFSHRRVLDGGWAVAAEDFDGDGAVDLAYADESALVVMPNRLP